MKDAEFEQLQGDLDIEVTNIDEAGTAVPVSESSHAVLRPRFSSRRRWQLLITAALVILTVLVILATTAPARNLVVDVFIRPTPGPTSTLVPGVDLFYVQGSPSWGQLSIDGHLVAHLPVIQSEPPLRLSRGHHVLAWQAEPFLTQRCTVSVPPRYADSCPLHETMDLGSDLFAWVIRFSVSLDFLPGEQRVALVQGQNCHLFCTGSAAVSSAGREWDVVAPVRVMWAFATFDGRVLEHEVPDNSLSDYATGAAVDEALMPLRITWDGLAWRVAADRDVHGSGYSNPACTAAQFEVQSLEPPPDASGNAVYLQWQFASSPAPVAGCLAEGTPQSYEGITPTPTHAPPFIAYCLHRFGVLLAVNNAAQRAWPDLPHVDAYEQGMIRQLATSIGAF